MWAVVGTLLLDLDFLAMAFKEREVFFIGKRIDQWK